MKKERKLLRVADLQLNEGQLGWLPKNPRQWTQEDIDKTAASIREDEDFLEERPILVIPIPGTGDFVVFCGNLRREGAKAAGLTQVPCVIHYPETEDDREAVLRRSLKDNGSFGRFDWDEMANNPVWGKFDAASFGIPSWPQPEGGEGVQPGVGGAGGGEAHEDDFDEESDDIHVRCKKGDIWQLGDHRIMCGDSTDSEMVKALMGGALADMVFTDPPYGVSIGDKNKTLREKVGGKSIVRNIENDTLPVDELYQVLKSAMENVRLNCKPDASYFVTAPQGGGLVFRDRTAGWRPRTDDDDDDARCRVGSEA